jgi:hypothetical protein
MRRNPRLKPESFVEWPRMPMLICALFGFAVWVALAAYGFAHFGFRPRLVTPCLLSLPGFFCIFAKLFGWRRRRKPAAAATPTREAHSARGLTRLTN